MSVNSEAPRLNPTGQMVLGGIASLVINGAVHPISTIKTRMMVNSMSPIALRGIYNGYWAICGVDAVAFGLSYATEDALKSRLSPISASAAPGLIAAPFISIGEGFVTNRQAHAMPYSQIFQRALRPAGLAATVMREVPFSVGVFYTSPLLERAIQHHLPKEGNCSSRDILVQGAAGFTAGACAGFATAPVDLIKTRVQTSSHPLSIMDAVRSVIADRGGYRTFFRGAGMRSLYVGLAGAGMHIVKNTAPDCLPEGLHRKQ